MTHETLDHLPDAVAEGLRAGRLAPYLGPGLLALCEGAEGWDSGDGPPLSALRAARVCR